MKAAIKDKAIEEKPAPSTELSLPERAQVALNSSSTEKRLVELSTEFKSITAITNKDGREECHSALMTVRNARTTIEKTAKAAREDATKFSKAVIAEENRLIAIISDEETRLAGIRDKWDQQKEIERKEAEEAERQRIEAIQNQIRDIKAIPYQFVSASLEEIQGRIELLEAEVPDPEYFGDLLLDAKIAHKESLHALRTRYTQKQMEIEQARIAEEQRKELEVQRADQARIAEEQAKAAAAIKAQQDAIKAQQDAIDAEKIRLEAEKLAATIPPAIETVIDVPLSPMIAALTAKEVRERLDQTKNNENMEKIIPEHKDLSTMTVDAIVAKVYLPTSKELYIYLHTCTMNHYGFNDKEAKRVIIEMAKEMKI